MHFTLSHEQLWGSLITDLFYLVSWHLHSWVHILARNEIHTNNYILLQFPKETNTRVSKTPTSFILFTEMYRVLNNKV